jgi:hypothetical protein
MHLNMRHVALVLLVPLLAGAAALAFWGPVRGYDVRCTKDTRIACTIERHTSSGPSVQSFVLDAPATADVRLMPVRRGSARILLYLVSAPHDVFAAEFEGKDAYAQAQAAAAQLNTLFAAAQPGAVRIEVRPPAYMQWMLWGAVAFLALLVAAAARAVPRGNGPPQA